MTPPDLGVPRRTSPLAALFTVFQPGQLRNFLPVIVVAASSGRFVLIAGLAAAVGSLYGVASWWRRTWSFTDGVLHLDEGIVTRNQRRIPVERIQHVEVERRLRHQIFSLAAVRVETAGGSDAELRLDAITHAEASTLRAMVLDRLRNAPASVAAEVADAADVLPTLGAPAPPPPPPPPPEVLVRLPAGRLFVAGVLGPEILAVFLALGFVLDTVSDLGIDPDDIDLSDTASQASRLAVLVAVLLAVTTWVGVAGLVSVIRKWDLTARIAGDELRVSYGLLQKNEFVVKTPRVRDVLITERALLRPLGRRDIRVRTAASGSGNQSRVDIPLLTDGEVERVLTRVLPAAVPLPTLTPAPPAARRRSLVRAAVVGVLLAGLLGILVALVVPILGLVAGVGALGASLVMGELRYRALGLAHDRALVHSRTGALTLRRAVVPEERVQSAATRASWFQRRRDLASVRLDLAGTAVGVIDRDHDDARSLVATVTP